jgi:uracil-DNA glycosylase
MCLKNLIPADWQQILDSTIHSKRFIELEQFLQQEWQHETIFPAKENIFEALKLTPYNDVTVLILGQDPYHDTDQAHGLCFSVQPGIKLPPSLRNIYKEMSSDLNIPQATHGCLESWARQGILLLNTVLTVRAHKANSHQKKGWEYFTDAVIDAVNMKSESVIFVLWGRSAQNKIPLIDTEKHHIISSAHPSPLSARHGFIGSKPFSTINSLLSQQNKKNIDWQLPENHYQPALF